MIELRSKHLAIILPAAFIAGIGLTVAFNLWQTTTTKEPVKYTTGEFAGQANPADIRGSYTFGDIVAAFPGVALDDLAAAFGATGDAAAFQVKTLEGAFATDGRLEVGTDSVRLFVARYLGLPFVPAATTGLPARAVDILAIRLGPEQVAELRQLAVGGQAATAARAPAAAPAETPSATAQTVSASAAAVESAPAAPADLAASTEDRSVKGKTTFKELADWGVADDALRQILGGVGASGVAVRDFCAEQGIEFSAVRQQIQALVDAAR